MDKGQLTFFGGAGTNGGVQVLYGRDKQAVLFDFGLEHRSLLFPKRVEFGPIGATPDRESRQFLLGGWTAPLPELYDPEDIRGLDWTKVSHVWNDRTFPQYEQVSLFISHMHTDHSEVLPYARPGIVAYMSYDSYVLYRGMVAGNHVKDTAANIHACEDLSIVDFGEFTMQIVEMDHNATGAAGIIIESADHRIAYTGDWRRQGLHPEKIDRFIDMCRSKSIDLLITEGTTLPKDRTAEVAPFKTEASFLLQYANWVREAEGLVYVITSPRDLEKMADMIIIAEEQGREVVMETLAAQIWYTAIREEMRALRGHPALHVKIKVVQAAVAGGRSVPYEKIDLEEIASRKSEIAYFFKYPDLSHLVELETLGELQGKSHFIYTDYGPKLEQADMAKFLNAYGITGHSGGGGGHAHPDAIADMIERIAPKAVIPLHANNPRSIRSRGIPVYHPEKGETASVASIISKAGIEV